MRRGGLELYIARECQGLAPRCGFRRVRKLFLSRLETSSVLRHHV